MAERMTGCRNSIAWCNCCDYCRCSARSRDLADDDDCKADNNSCVTNHHHKHSRITLSRDNDDDTYGAAIPMLTLVNHDCDAKGGSDSLYERCHMMRAARGMNGFSVGGAGRTRTVSSGYTSDKDLDEMMHVSTCRRPSRSPFSGAA